MKQGIKPAFITPTELLILVVGVFMIAFSILNKDIKSNSSNPLVSLKQKNLNLNTRSIASLETTNTDDIRNNLEIQKIEEKQNKEYLAFLAEKVSQESQIDSRTNRFLQTSTNPYDSGQIIDQNKKDYELVEAHNAYLNLLKEEESTEELEWDVAASSLNEETE